MRLPTWMAGRLRRVADEVREQGGQAAATSGRRDPQRRSAADGCPRPATSWGDLRILVNNAGYRRDSRRYWKLTKRTWDALMNVNAKSVLLCSQAAALQMTRTGRRRAASINNASGAGLKSRRGKNMPLGAYAASKHAVVALTKQMGLELSDHGILVNCVCAGIVDTPMWDLIDRETAARQGAPVGSIKAQGGGRSATGPHPAARRRRQPCGVPGLRRRPPI